jgi:hypothetical protein
MLTRVGPDSFTADTDSATTVVAKSDDGAPSATFRYGKKLPPLEIQGLPACKFDVVAGAKMFGCTVVFGQGAAPRYDLYEVDANGLLVDLDMPLTPNTTGTMRQASITGVGVPELAPAAGARRAKAKAKPKARKKAKRSKKARGSKKAKGTKKATRTKKAGGKQTKGRKPQRRQPQRRGGARR